MKQSALNGIEFLIMAFVAAALTVAYAMGH